MVRLLVGAGASVNFPDRKGNTSIHLAAQRRDVRLLQLLSQATSPLPDFNSRNFAGTLPSQPETSGNFPQAWDNGLSSPFVLGRASLGTAMLAAGVQV